MEHLESTVKAFVMGLAPYLEASWQVVVAIFQFVVSAPEAVAIVSATCLLALASIASVRHARRRKRRMAARRMT